jgi:WXG100 family type VII secretion target
MSGDMIKYDFAAVENLGGAIDGQVRAIDGYLNTLETAIKKLFSTWQGGTGEAAQAVQQNFIQSAEDLKGVLSRIATAVHAAADAARHTESTNAQAWG